MSPPPDTDWLRRHYREPDVQSGFGQSIDACVTTGTTRWGGIGFYGDEDGWGVGGLVKKDMTTGTFEYRRPYRLLDQSVSKLGYFADRLWLGTAHHGECVGPEPGNGLFLYDAGDFVREVPEVCGFAIRAMTVYDDSFWVASDLGLARGRRDSNGQVVWQNFVPDLADEQLMRPVTCDALYEELLRSPELATDTAFDRGFAFEEFWNELSSLRRDFVSRYLRRLHGHKPASE